MKENIDRRSIRVLIVTLAVLLAISVVALTGLLLYKHFATSGGGSAVVSDNVITPDRACVPDLRIAPLYVGAEPSLWISPIAALPVDRAEGRDVVLEIYRNHADDAAAFYADNMFPGDSLNKYYYVEVSYKGSVTLNFRADIRSGYEKLAEVLKCRITLQGGEALYDGLMRDMPQSIPYILPQSSGTTETVIYSITVYLDTSVGNEYMNKELYADFHWWVDEDAPDTTTADTTPPDTPPTTTKPSGGELIPPRTGYDMSNIRILVFFSAVALLLFIIIFLLSKRRKKSDETEDEV